SNGNGERKQCKRFHLDADLSESCDRWYRALCRYHFDHPPGTKKEALMRFIKNVFGIACIIFGIGIFAYPVVTTQYSAYQTEEYIREYDDTWQSADKQTKKKKKALLQEAHTYNASIYAEKQEGFCDAWSYTQQPFDLKGLKDGKFGYIKIPAMDVKLPLYIGASKENLSKGAAVLGQTSLPVGGT